MAGLAPHRSAGSYVGSFQAVQGAVAAAATYLGPVTAAVSPTAFAVAGLALAAAGATALTALRRLVQTGLDQPVDCPCGAVLCRCGGLDLTCVGPAPLIPRRATAALMQYGAPPTGFCRRRRESRMNGDAQSREWVDGVIAALLRAIVNPAS